MIYFILVNLCSIVSVLMVKTSVKLRLISIFLLSLQHLVRTILFDWIRLDLQHRTCLGCCRMGSCHFKHYLEAASSLCVDHNRNACKLIEKQSSDLGANITCLLL